MGKPVSLIYWLEQVNVLVTGLVLLLNEKVVPLKSTVIGKCKTYQGFTQCHLIRQKKKWHVTIYWVIMRIAFLMLLIRQTWNVTFIWQRSWLKQVFLWPLRLIWAMPSKVKEKRLISINFLINLVFQSFLLVLLRIQVLIKLSKKQHIPLKKPLIPFNILLIVINLKRLWNKLLIS